MRLCSTTAIVSAASLAVALGRPAVEAAAAPAFEPPVYEAYRTDQPITIDGRLDEPAWFRAPAITAFSFPWWQAGDQEQTVVKVLWDDKMLYIAHICQDAHITARYDKHDDPVPEDDCFEIMIQPDPQQPNYYNIEWNLRGAYVDGRRPDGPQAPRAEWDVRGFQHAGVCVGTPNDDGDRDSYWLCEVAIPLENFADAMPHAPPRPGDQWRINFNRHGGAVNMQYSQWSPVDSPTPAFHAPHRFGRLIFSAHTSPFQAPPPGPAAVEQEAKR